MNSVSSALLVLVMVCFLTLGVTLGGAELLNPERAEADAERVGVEARYKQQLYDFQLNAEKAKARAEVKRLEEERLYQQRLHEQELRTAQERAALATWLLELAGYAVIVLVVLCLLSLTVGYSVRVARGSAAAVSTARAATHSDEWTGEHKSRAIIEAARKREREERQQVLEQSRSYESLKVPAGSGDGRGSKETAWLPA
jgi:hypothetical protein